MMISRGFWESVPRPIIGLAPMDGVTNAPFRLLTARIGRPQIIFTEFVPTAGLMHGAVKLLTDFSYDDAERPVVAQIYGNEPGECYAVAHLVCALGFDGLDINMGCPAKNVAARGAGAGLIRTPHVAQAMIREARRGVQDWCGGQSLHAVGIPAKVITAVRDMNARTGRSVPCELASYERAPVTHTPRASAPRARAPIPVTVKTRIGYDSITILDWVKYLLDAEPVVISLHGRTLQQMYRGEADWDAIAQAAEIIHQTETLVLGNGDIASAAAAAERIRTAQVDGVLIGRAAMGNPWIFDETAAPTPRAQLDAFVEHARLVETLAPPHAFSQLFRFVKPYTAGIPGAAMVRPQIYHVTSSRALRELLSPLYQQLEPQESDAPHSGLDLAATA